MIIDAIRSTPEFTRLTDRIPAPGEERVLAGLPGSAPAVLAAALSEAGAARRLLVVAPTAPDAEEVEADLEALLPGRSRVFPQRESVHPDLTDPHIEISARRVDSLQALITGRAHVMVTTGRALGERFVVPPSWSDLEIRLEAEQELDRDSLLVNLETAGYRKVPMVEAVGEYSARGGIVDIYPITTLDPIRLEFCEDTIESIRSFDILDQRSITHLESVRLLPVRLPARDDSAPAGGAEHPAYTGSLLELLPESTLILQLDTETEETERRKSWEELQRRTETPEVYQDPPDSVRSRLSCFGRLRVVDAPEGVDQDFGVLPPPLIDRRIERLVAAVHDALSRGARLLILCDNEGQLERLEEILEDAAGASALRAITLGLSPLAGGFVIAQAEPPLWLFTDHEIFRRARRPRRRPQATSRAALDTLSALSPGDYVVHLDHGIGRYRGLELVTIGGAELETLAVEYAGGDTLRVPHYRADLVERWISDAGDDEGVAPKLHRLGSKSWQRVKKRARDAVQTMAAELLELYAARRIAKAHAFSPDTRWQREMESAFIYEETPDQERVADQVKRAMERPQPMDLLICGDVGYGKTEIAIRAAFKAVQDGAQVAVLAPTTVLVEQHLQTFRARLAEYPVVVESLSRFRTASEQDTVVRRLAEGAIDIVIGTHRVLSTDVEFKNLGLLVIDEEQQFGVTQKERLKALKRNVHVITMTATPIPRTLHLSLSGLRDLAVIRTAPRNRQPIITHMMTWDDQTLEDAIRLEVDRGGQVFFVHNRVESIGEVAAKVRRLLPELRIEVAHGQMAERKLEKTMTEFVRGEIQVLVATAIIENGLDVPNANTMIVHQADYFGLAQLYQLRGRVGRSHQRAFCYLIVPPKLPPETERRLTLLEKHTELGAGYRLALRDLELRGAGSLLGTEQSGLAQAVGFDTYIRLLEDTVAALRSGDGERAVRPEAPEVSISGATYIPESFIPDERQKLDLYRRLSKVSDLDEVEHLTSELRDRFGRLPPEVERLIAASRIRILGGGLGAERVLATPGTARVSFRRGVVPRLTSLRDALTGREVEVEVRRLQPLSLVFRVAGSSDIAPIVVEALERMLEEQGNS